MSFYLPSPYLPNIGSLNHAWHEECGIVIVGILYIYNLYLWRQQVICRGSVRVGAFASAGWMFIDACKRPAASDIFWPSKKKFTTFTLACQWDLSVREPELKSCFGPWLWFKNKFLSAMQTHCHYSTHSKSTRYFLLRPFCLPQDSRLQITVR